MNDREHIPPALRPPGSHFPSSSLASRNEPRVPEAQKGKIPNRTSLGVFTESTPSSAMLEALPDRRR